MYLEYHFNIQNIQYHYFNFNIYYKLYNYFMLYINTIIHNIHLYIHIMTNYDLVHNLLNIINKFA